MRGRCGAAAAASALLTLCPGDSYGCSALTQQFVDVDVVVVVFKLGLPTAHGMVVFV